MDKWLNRLGQLAMIAIAVAALIAVLSPQPSVAPEVAKPYGAGDTIDLRKIPVSGPTLLIATRSTCGFCTDSIPFWRTISGVPIVWLAVGEDASTNSQYLTSNGLKADKVVTVAEAGATKISATPTVILVDGNGVVIEAWVGLLGSDAQEDLRSRLARLPNS